MTPVGRVKTERTGYPTQKPLALYERVIKASSNAGDIALDPFAGCATTCVAAERLGRQWIGMDIWAGAYDLVKQRMEDNRQLLADPDAPIRYTTRAPAPTDEGEEPATPTLVLRAQRVKAKWERLSHAERCAASSATRRRNASLFIGRRAQCRRCPNVAGRSGRLPVSSMASRTSSMRLRGIWLNAWPISESWWRLTEWSGDSTTYAAGHR